MPAETILLVEDETSIRELLATSLERAGYRVLQARNGAEALDLFDDSIDLLLTDLKMPYVSGESLIGALTSRSSRLKVLAFSGFPYKTLPVDVPFLAKPFTRDQLLQAITKALAQ